MAAMREPKTTLGIQLLEKDVLVDPDVDALAVAPDEVDAVDEDVVAGLAVDAAVAGFVVAVDAAVDVDAEAEAPEETSRLLEVVQTPVSVEREAAEASAAGVEPQLVYCAIQTTLSVWSITTMRSNEVSMRQRTKQLNPRESYRRPTAETCLPTGQSRCSPAAPAYKHCPTAGSARCTAHAPSCRQK